MVEKEARVVESEFRKNYSQDVRKINQVKRSLADTEASYNKFGTGNFETYFPKSFELRQ
jgi:secreted Zn-dependent insulinase-like peptidase